MQILQNVNLVNLSLYLKKYKLLVIGDLHLGYEESLNKKGILLPHFQLNDMKNEIDKIKNLDVEQIIFLGDIKHEFSKILRQERSDINSFLDYINDKFNNPKIVIIKGNHDNFLKPIINKKKINLVDFFIIDEFLFIHGDKLIEIPKNIETIVIGHEHPAITLINENRKEKFKCFLKGNYNKYNLIVLPSFFNITDGTDILREKLISPFIKKATNLEIFITADKIYYFGKLKELQNGGPTQT